MHYEIVTAQATAAAVLGSAGAALTGDSLTIKNGKGKIAIIAGWSSRQAAGFSQWIWPSGHDTTRGWRCGVPIAKGNLIMPLGVSMDVEAQETLASLIGEAATAGDIAQDSLLVYYENFPGISMRTVSPAEWRRRVDKFVTVESSIAAVATGQYVSEAITADSDLLKANRDYAVLGMSCRTAVQSLTLQAPDFGNVRIGCPGNLRPEITNQFFDLMARVHNLDLVPVFNTGNKGNVNVGFSDDENAAACVVTLHLAMLK